MKRGNLIVFAFLIILSGCLQFTGGKYPYTIYNLEGVDLTGSGNFDFIAGGWYNGTDNFSIGYLAIFDGDVVQQINVTGPTDTGGSMVRHAEFNNLTDNFTYVAYGYYENRAITANYSGITRFTLNTSNYNLTENLSFYVGGQYDQIDGFLVNDWDGDGYPDIFIAGGYGYMGIEAKAWLYSINSTLTNFTERYVYNETAFATLYGSPVMGDFLGTGEQLVAVPSGNNNTTGYMPIFNVTSDLELTMLSNLSLAQDYNPQMTDLEVYDYDGDGDDEILFTGHYCLGGSCPQSTNGSTYNYGMIGLIDFNDSTNEPYLVDYVNGINISNNRTTVLYDIEVADFNYDLVDDIVVSGAITNWTYNGIQGWWEPWDERYGNFNPVIKTYGILNDEITSGDSDTSMIFTQYNNATAFDLEFRIINNTYTGEGVIGFGTNDALLIDNTTLNPFFDATWYSVDYRYRRKMIVIEDLGINRTNDQFTFLLNVTNTSSINCSSGIIVLDSNDTTEHPINLSRTYNDTHCEVRIPFNITANTNETIHVYYGTPNSSTFTPYSDGWGESGETIKRGQAYVTGTACSSSGTKRWFTGYCPNFNMFDGIDDPFATEGFAPSDEGYCEAIADYNYSGNTGYDIWQLNLDYYVYATPATPILHTIHWRFWFYDWEHSEYDLCDSGSLVEGSTINSTCQFISSDTLEVMDYINETTETYRVYHGWRGSSSEYSARENVDVTSITVSYNLKYEELAEVDSHLEPAEIIYNSPIVEGSNQTYQLKINQSDYLQNVTAVLFLNGTERTPTYYTDSADHIFEYNHSWPLSGDENITFYWDYNATMGRVVEETNTSLATVEIYESPIYYNNPITNFELQNLTYFISVNVSDNGVVDAVLLWNGTEYTPTVDSTTGQYNFTYNFTTPTISANNTSIEWNWLYNITSLGEVVERNTSENLTLIYAVYPHTANWTPEFIIEGRTIYFNTTILDLNHLEDSITVTYHIWNNTTGTADFISRTGNYSLFEFNETAEFIDDLNETSYLNITASFNPNRTVSWNLTTYGAYLTNCSAESASQNKTLTFYIRDEANGSLISDELKISVTLTDPELAPFGFEFSNNSTYSICIFPENASYPNTEIELEYGSDGYGGRIWAAIRTLTNINQDINLYLLDENDGQNVVFQVRDLSTNLLVPGLTIYIQRRYFELGAEQYLTVATVITGAEGKGKAFVDTNAIYKFIVLDENDTIFEYAPTQITSDPTELQIGYSLFGGWNQINNIQSSCHFTGVDNKTVSCSVIDSTGADVDVCLQVYDYSSWYREEICSSCTSGTGAVTMTCNATSAVSSIQYTFSYNYGGLYQIIEQGIRDLTSSTSPLGIDGVMVAFVSVITLAMIGTMIHPIVGFVLGTLTFLFLDLMNIYDMPPSVYGPLILIFAIASVVMAKKERIL